MSKEILIISNYYPPESGAAPNRIQTLAYALRSNNYQVSVVCPLPNYPFGKIFDNYIGSFQKKSIEENIVVYRLWLLASNSKNKFVRLFSMLSFGIHLFFFLLFKRTPKKVVIQCSPLFVGFFGVLVSRIKRKTIILNVSDLWPLAGLEMGILKKGGYYSFLEKIELYNYKKADLVLGQSQEILEHLDIKTPNKKSFLYRNYPDFKMDFDVKQNDSDKIKIVYAGLLGIAQGILNICKSLQLPENVEFHIYGNGPEAAEIDKLTQSKKNIFYHGSVNRSELHQRLKVFDITLIPLINRIYGSVPSKIFEYARLGLPIIYFSEGEGNEIVKNNGLGEVVDSLDYIGLNETIHKIASNTITLPGKAEVLNIATTKFDLEMQFKAFLQEIERL